MLEKMDKKKKIRSRAFYFQHAFFYANLEDDPEYDKSDLPIKVLRKTKLTRNKLANANTKYILAPEAIVSSHVHSGWLKLLK